jgi:hypothetical protein
VGDFVDVYRADEVPLHSCLLLDSRDRALRFPRGRVDLQLCRTCGLIRNQAFDESAMSYSSDYEDSQAHSPRFRHFATDLIDRLNSRYDLAGKHAVEIGCGKGDFLVLLSNQLGMTGLGIDPAYRPGPIMADDPARVRFTTERFTAGFDLGDIDLLVCRHTLEHVQDPGAFVSDIRTALGDRTETVVFFEIPDSRRILAESAFWDIYYEHCSYFVSGSVRYLFETRGFEVLETWLGMDGQYLMVTAIPTASSGLADTSYVPDLELEAKEFRAGVTRTVSVLREGLDEASSHGGTVVLWGASSKAVAYLHALDVHDEVAAVVDINPVKQGMYLAGSGLPIVAPDDLEEIGPGTVIVMNPVYQKEIRDVLEARNIMARVVALEAQDQALPSKPGIESS